MQAVCSVLDYTLPLSALLTVWLGDDDEDLNDAEDQDDGQDDDNQ